MSLALLLTSVANAGAGLVLITSGINFLFAAKDDFETYIFQKKASEHIVVLLEKPDNSRGSAPQDDSDEEDEDRTDQKQSKLDDPSAER